MQLGIMNPYVFGNINFREISSYEIAMIRDKWNLPIRQMSSGGDEVKIYL